ncbi:MAG: hypothetical protein E7B29_11045, partial [Mixta calida]|nr:hypothetical protein [Mixta calida]
MSSINTSMGRYSLKAKNAGDHIKGSIAINDEGGGQLSKSILPTLNFSSSAKSLILATACMLRLEQSLTN